MKQFFLALCLLTSPVFAQNPPAYSWFSSSGKKSSFEKMVREASRADVVIFGELHDDPVAHWMQWLLVQELWKAKGAQLQLGAEMFERNQQWALDKYLSGVWTSDQLADSVKMWSNFKTDYLPLLKLAQENKIPFVATNIPRPYASRVFKKGLSSLDSLSEKERAWVCPLPFEMDTTLSQYRELIKMGMEMHSNGMNFALAQAIKDATMAYSILQMWKPGNLFLHFNGSYHSDFYQSIVWYLKRNNPELKIVTISTVNQDNVRKLESEYNGKADFILAVPNGMTRTL